MPSWEVWEEVGFRSLSTQWKQFAAVPSGLYLAANSRCSAVDWYRCNESEMTKASFLLHWYLYQVFIQWDETSNTFYYDKQHFKGHKSCFNWHFLLSVVLQVFLKPPFFLWDINSSTAGGDCSAEKRLPFKWLGEILEHSEFTTCLTRVLPLSYSGTV